jgi:hypothetical protein
MNPWSPRQVVLLWLLFFAICAGLGYPVLNRYDPRQCPGMGDVIQYADVMVHGAGRMGRNSLRVLQPWAARPIYWLVREGIGPWDPIAFALLCTASAFVATEVLVLMVLARKMTHEVPAALLAGLLFVVNFWVPNSMLIGMVDASECLFLLLTAWAMYRRLFWVLPFLGVLGTLSKETFAVLGTALCVGWQLTADWRARRFAIKPYLAIGAFAGLALFTPTAVRLLILGQWVWPWEQALEQRSEASLSQGFLDLIKDPGFYYGFVWLLPLACPQLRRLPWEWLAGTLLAGAVAVVLGTMHDAGGTNVGRPLFSLLGPPLSIGAALTLLRFGAGRPAPG